MGEAGVEREADQLDVRADGIARLAAAALRADAADEHEPFDVGPQPGEEQREGALRVDLVAHPVVRVVRVDAEPHAGTA
jgi:hypothetical protein